MPVERDYPEKKSIFDQVQTNPFELIMRECRVYQQLKQSINRMREINQFI